MRFKVTVVSKISCMGEGEKKRNHIDSAIPEHEKLHPAKIHGSLTQCSLEQAIYI